MSPDSINWFKCYRLGSNGTLHTVAYLCVIFGNAAVSVLNFACTVRASQSVSPRTVPVAVAQEHPYAFAVHGVFITAIRLTSRTIWASQRQVQGWEGHGKRSPMTHYCGEQKKSTCRKSAPDSRAASVVAYSDGGAECVTTLTKRIQASDD